MSAFIWTIEEVAAPASEPVSLAEAKGQCNVEVAETYWDDTLTFLIVAAREKVETDSTRALITRSFKQYVSRWPNSDRFALMRQPVSAVTHVKWTDDEGTVTTLTVNTDYLADLKSKPPAIVLPYNESWPSGTLNPASPIEVQFVAGYANAAAVPSKFKLAMRLLIGHWFKHRESIVLGSSSTLAVEVPQAYQSLIDMDKAIFFGNGNQ